MEEFTGVDPGQETSGYVEGTSEQARQEQLKTLAARSSLLELPGRFMLGPAPVVRTEGGVKYVVGAPYYMLMEWRDRVSLNFCKLPGLPSIGSANNLL